MLPFALCLPPQYSYIRNISAFLQACQSKFRIKESDLFTESDLYDVDNFKKVKWKPLMSLAPMGQE